MIFAALWSRELNPQAYEWEWWCDVLVCVFGGLALKFEPAGFRLFDHLFDDLGEVGVDLRFVVVLKSEIAHPLIV